MENQQVNNNQNIQNIQNNQNNQYLRKTEFSEDKKNNLNKSIPNIKNNTQNINLPMNNISIPGEVLTKEEESPDSDEEVFVYNFTFFTNLYFLFLSTSFLLFCFIFQKLVF